MVTSRGMIGDALLRFALGYLLVPLRSAHKLIPYEDRKETQGVVTLRGRTRMALLSLVLFIGPSVLSAQTHTLQRN